MKALGALKKTEEKKAVVEDISLVESIPPLVEEMTTMKIKTV